MRDGEKHGWRTRRGAVEHATRVLLALVATMLVQPAAGLAQVTPTPSASAESTAEAAMQAYRDSLAAFERGDGDAYFGAFADCLVCFYEAATRISMEAVRSLAGGEVPLVCGDLWCGLDADSNSDPHLEARREDGRLRISVDGRDWISGDNVPARDRARMGNERCPVTP
jgi:hypothetical protein